MAASVPRKKRSESWTAYHDRLASLIVKAEGAKDYAFSQRLQQAAGQVARAHENVRTMPRKFRQTGPGTYPFAQCLEDQARRGSKAFAPEICGRIRQDSRERYPTYWAARGDVVATSNPGDDDPSLVLVFDGGPTCTPRASIVVFNSDSAIADIIDIADASTAVAELERRHPGLAVKELPVIPVLAPFLRDLRDFPRQIQRWS